MELNLKIPNLALQATVPSAKLLTPAEQRDEFLDTLQQLLDRARPSLKCTQEEFKIEFDGRPCKGVKRIRPGHYVFIEVSDTVNTLML